MSQEKSYKCGFKHCKHTSDDVIQSEAVKVGARYMHKDCSIINENISKIRDVYYEKVSKTVVMKQLVSVINNLVFVKNIDSGYLLFAINCALSTKVPIKSPYGLHYIIDNQKIKDAWNKRNAQEIVARMNDQTEQQEINVEPVKFKFIADKNDGFGSIFKGGN